VVKGEKNLFSPDIEQVISKERAKEYGVRVRNNTMRFQKSSVFGMKQEAEHW